MRTKKILSDPSSSSLDQKIMWLGKLIKDVRTNSVDTGNLVHGYLPHLGPAFEFVTKFMPASPSKLDTKATSLFVEAFDQNFELIQVYLSNPNPLNCPYSSLSENVPMKKIPLFLAIISDLIAFQTSLSLCQKTQSMVLLTQIKSNAAAYLKLDFPSVVKQAKGLTNRSFNGIDTFLNDFKDIVSQLAKISEPNQLAPPLRRIKQLLNSLN